MDRVLYLSMSGAKQTMLAQAASNNNLANANTTAFRSDFTDFMAMPVYGPGHPTRVYGMARHSATDQRPGVVQTTGRDLDVAIQGNGWFAVQAADGTEAYTRAGDLRIAAGGLLTNGAGQVMLGNGGPIVLPPADKIEIGVDGTISIVGVGQPASSLSVVDRLKLVDPGDREMEKGKDGLMRTKDGSAAPPAASVRLAVGSLESSNVNVVEALVQQITMARQYELQVKMMNTAADMDSATTQMMRVS